MSAVIIVLIVMTIPSMVRDRPGVLRPPLGREKPSSPGLSLGTHLWNLLLLTPPAHPTEPSGHCIKCTFISCEFSQTCSAQQRQIEIQFRVTNRVACSCHPSQRAWALGPGHLGKEATSPQPVSVLLAILAPASMSPGLKRLCFKYSMAS